MHLVAVGDLLGAQDPDQEDVSNVNRCRKTAGRFGDVTDLRDDEEDKRPASRRVADELKSAIEAGTYAVGAALPPLREIAVRHG